MTTCWKNNSCKQGMQARCRKYKILSWAGQRNSPELKTHDMLCKKMEVWEVDDGDILCHPILVPSYLQEIDDAHDKIAAERNPQKAEVIFYVADLAAAPPEWKVDEVRKLASVSTAATGSNTRGVAAGPRQFIADQLPAKADVIRAIHERVQLCQDPQTEFALLRESLGVSRINHILRLHGHTILQDKRSADMYDEVAQRSLERLFPGITEDTSEQATLSAGKCGIGD